MNDPFREVFSADVLTKLKEGRDSSKELQARLDILTASGPLPLDRFKAYDERYVRARKARWEAYLDAASACGLLTGDVGADVRGRLTGTNDDHFRSAMAECMACWFFLAQLKLSVAHRGLGRPGRIPDLCVRSDTLSVTVEVKAPYSPPPDGAMRGNYSRRLADTIDQANKQFAEGAPNVLVVVTNTDNQFFGSRVDLVRAFIGEDELWEGVMPSPRWKVSKVWDKGAPRFTRVGAVVRLREQLELCGGVSEPVYTTVEPRWVVLHNPFCPVPIPTDIWGDCPQLLVDGDVVRWTDGRRILEE
jgi:hypothetical protein